MADRDACVFCKIVRGEAEGFRVYEDEGSVAFMDIFPVSEGHTLVVTKEHFESIFEASPEALAATSVAARKVARAIRTALDPSGLTVAQLNGAAAGQSVFHYHVHLIPRTGGDPFQMHGRKRAEPERLRELSEKIARAVERG